MRKIKRIVNIALIFTLIGVFLLNSTASYAVDLSKKTQLRTHSMSNSKKGKRRLDDSLAAILNPKRKSFAPLRKWAQRILFAKELNGEDESSTDGLGKKRESGEFRTFMQFCSESFSKAPNMIHEIERYAFWPLYLMQINRAFIEVSDYRKAYNEFYRNYSLYITDRKIRPKSVSAYVPVARKPFSSIKEIKDIVGVSYEWNIDFFLEPDAWKGLNLFSFILCLMNNGQLHMSLYDGNGIIRELTTDEEVESALREIGIIGKQGMVILVPSSLHELLRNSAVPGIGGRISISGHSHPKGSNVKPSQSKDWDSPADIELFTLGFWGLPEEFPVDENMPMIARRAQDETSRHAKAEPIQKDTDTNAKLAKLEPDIPNDQLLNALEAYAEKIEQFAASHGSKLPINELGLYIRVLIGMYKETIERYKKADHKYVHQYKAEFAGELAHHARFLGNALKMFEESYEGGFRILARQDPGMIDSLSSLEEMIVVVDQVIGELAVHPESRGMAINLINNPATYGLDEEVLRKERKLSMLKDSFSKKAKDLVGSGKKETNKIPKREKGGLMSIDNVIAPTTITTSEDFALVSDRLINAAEKGEEKQSSSTNTLKPTVEEVIRERRLRLLGLANLSVNDDPELAEAAMREYLRLLKKFGDKVDFYCATSLDRCENIMASQPLRPVLFEIAENISEDDDKRHALIAIAHQMIREGAIDDALQLLEDVGLSNALEELIDILYPSAYVVSDAKSIKSLVKSNSNRISRLEKIIKNISIHEAGFAKVELLIAIGDKYYRIGQRKKAEGFYKKAWDTSERIKKPSLGRLKYLVPLIREKNIKFPKDRVAILREATNIAKAELQRDYSDENPRPMILVAREHAFNREYDEAEECATFIQDNMSFPRDHFDHCYGAIIEGAALYGDYEKVSYAASKMTHYTKDYFEDAAMMLINRGRYQEAMELGDYAMAEGYEGTPSVWYWGSTQLRIAGRILEKDVGQIETVRKYLEKSIEATGIGSLDLKAILKLFLKYPDLDPDGEFVLKIYKTAFEKNQSFVKHDSHRIILKGLREIILAKAKKVDPSFVRMPDVYGQADKDLGINGNRLLPGNSNIQTEKKLPHRASRTGS